MPLGGEWTTRRRTISEAEIAIFVGVAGDLSPLAIEAPAGGRRMAPPALVVAVAIGLGTVDMPVPYVVEWEWLNWKFPRPVHAGDTIYARWTLTQKRPPIGGALTSIVVWRVDVHLADGTMCAEGEVGAKVSRRKAASGTRSSPAADRPAPAEPTTSAASAAAPRRRRRGRRPAGANGPVPETAAVATPVAVAAPKPERTGQKSASAPRRRRRRRPAGAAPSAAHDGEPSPAAPPPSEPATSAPAPPAPGDGERGTLSRVIRRLRRT